jgi:hypothetical protein
VTFNHELPVCDDQKQLALYLRYQTTRKSESGMGKPVKKPSTPAAKPPKIASNAQAKVDNQELQNMRLETPGHRIQGRVERIIAAENAA